MKQLIQNLKNGKMELQEVPVPALHPGNLLVKTHYSLISTGTESTKVANARKGYIGKAKAKPEQFRQVVDSAKNHGIISTYNKVMNKLDASSPLGYSCSGEVIEVGENINSFKIGDVISCGGYAFHAEVNSVPKNLCAKIPANVKLEHAAYATLGAIAMQGVRQADLHIGESCAVIGLGLIGQLTIQILKAGGIAVAGIDIDKKMAELAKKAGADQSYERNVSYLENSVIEMSEGHGVDAVIIAAGTSSLDPVELAGKLCRKKGKVVIVGDVPTGFSRENYYKKELSLLMSCSYGPGRYDPAYEEKGIDYPIGYARWTENRNMQAFLKLVNDGKINLDLLTSHIFQFEEAIQAYELIMNKTEPHTGILIKYDSKKEIHKKVNFNRHTNLKTSAVNIGFIGAGSFAQKSLLPNAKKFGNLIGVATSFGHTSQNITKKYGFQFATCDYKKICSNNDINTVFIATRNNLHSELVIESLKHNKHVFVEKPLCLNIEDLKKIISTYNKSHSKLMVGFNRRFSPFITKACEHIERRAKKVIIIRINAGQLPHNDWAHDLDIGGGRILSEVCHFIDLALFLSGSDVKQFSAFKMDDNQNLSDTITINLKFNNGSIANICYLSNGSSLLSKENIEIHYNGISISIDDFKYMKVFKGNSVIKYKQKQDKGHNKEVDEFLKSVKNGERDPISFKDICSTSLLTLKISEYVKNAKENASFDSFTMLNDEVIIT